MTRLPQVTIIQRILPHYRIPFFERLRSKLSEDGIDLKLIYGQEFPGTVPRTQDIHEAWATKVKNHYFRVLGHELVYQPSVHLSKDSDLIIVEQANRLISNYLFFKYRPKLAFWGHGKNMQAIDRISVNEWVKMLFIKYPSWWFAYTDLSSQLIKSAGYPKSRITVVDNALDTESLTESFRNLDSKRLSELRGKLGIRSENICIYCGSMYPEKRLGFLISACIEIKKHIRDFEMIFIGEGVSSDIVEDANRAHSWIHYYGPKYGNDRAAYILMSKAMLIPSAVGLVVMDSLALQTPIITTNSNYHGPEIEYIQHGRNGVITDSSITSYVNKVVDFLKSSSAQSCLAMGCIESSKRYTLDNMVVRFTNGIKAFFALRHENNGSYTT